MKKLITIIFGFILLIPTISFAENKDVKLSIEGETNPGSSVRVKLSYPYSDLGGTTIFWLENDKVVEEGVNLTSHTVNLLSFGETIKVTAIVGIPNSRGQIKNSIIVAPATMNLIWEAQTAVPPFYKGKALPTTESPVRAMAIAYFGTTTPTTNTTYSWKKNGKTSIGEGVNLTNTVFLGAWEGEAVSISANAKYGDLTASKSMIVPSVKPSLLFYEVSPTQGVLTQELLNNNPIRNTVELAIKVIPFGFSNKEKNNDRILYEWSVGNKKVRTGKGTAYETITLSKSDIALKIGEIPVKLLAQNTSNVMQYTEMAFKWVFKE